MAPTVNSILVSEGNIAVAFGNDTLNNFFIQVLDTLRRRSILNTVLLH